MQDVETGRRRVLSVLDGSCARGLGATQVVPYLVLRRESNETSVPPGNSLSVRGDVSSPGLRRSGAFLKDGHHQPPTPPPRGTPGLYLGTLCPCTVAEETLWVGDGVGSCRGPLFTSVGSHAFSTGAGVESLGVSRGATVRERKCPYYSGGFPTRRSGFVPSRWALPVRCCRSGSSVRSTYWGRT